VSDPCTRIDDAASYALGAMPERESAEYAFHVQACAACAAAVSELQRTADCLARAVPQRGAPEEVRARLMAQVRSEAELLRAAGPEADRPAPRPRRRRQWLLGLRPMPAAALAAVLLALGVGGGTLLGSSDDPSGTRTLHADVDERAAPSGRAELRLGSDGSQLIVTGMPAPPSGRIYQMWLDRANDGRPPQATDVLFSVNRRGRASVAVPDGRDRDAAVLVTEEPLGGSDVPSSQPVITARPS
jgi:hypothetical protein